MFFRRIHLYLALAAGLVFFVQCLTGTVLVFEEEITHALYPARYGVAVPAGQPRLALAQLPCWQGLPPSVRADAYGRYHVVPLGYRKPFLAHELAADGGALYPRSAAEGGRTIVYDAAPRAGLATYPTADFWRIGAPQGPLAAVAVSAPSTLPLPEHGPQYAVRGPRYRRGVGAAPIQPANGGRAVAPPDQAAAHRRNRRHLDQNAGLGGDAVQPHVPSHGRTAVAEPYPQAPAQKQPGGGGGWELKVNSKELQKNVMLT